jgi:hypothetical protein
VTVVLVLGLCLFCGQGYGLVIARLWPLLAAFNPVVVLCASGLRGGVVTGQSEAAGRAAAGVVHLRRR